MANPQWPGAGHPQGATGQRQQDNMQAVQWAGVFAGHPTSGLQLTTGFIPLQWILYLRHPVIELNGHGRDLSWGTETIPLPPGRYDVRVYVPGFFRRMYDSHTTLTIYPHYLTGMTFRAAWFTFMPGTLRELGYKPWGS